MVPQPKRQNEPTLGVVPGVAHAALGGTAFLVTNPLGLLEAWGMGQFLRVRPCFSRMDWASSILAGGGFCSQPAARPKARILSALHHQKNGSCLSALLCTCQMAWTCVLLGQVTLEVFWEAPEHFPPSCMVYYELYHYGQLS